MRAQTQAAAGVPPFRRRPSLTCKPIVGLDYETYCELDLTEVGPWAYTEHPSCDVISAAYVIDDGDPVLWLPGDPLPDFALHPERYELHAYNAFFEWCVWHKLLKWVKAPIRLWHDTRAKALAMALPRDLETTCEVLRLPDELAKLKEGKDLIKDLCSPDKHGKRCRDPIKLTRFYEYNKQDTVAERAVRKCVRDLTPAERELWELDFKINIRGVPLDGDLLRSASRLYTRIKPGIITELKELTRLDNPNSVPQFKGWLHARGHKVPNCQAVTMTELKEAANDPQLSHIIDLRSQLGRTPLAKYASVLRRLGADGRFHGALEYHKATTGRWASTGVNFQNLTHPKLSLHDIELAVDLIKYGDPALLDMFFDEHAIEVLSSCLRSMIRARPGYKLIVADYSSIESRVLAWLAGQLDKLDVFRGHGKVYEHIASVMYGLPIDQITKGSPERMTGKIGELLCGFEGGWKAIVKGAIKQGLHISRDQAEKIKTGWRAANPAIVALWTMNNKAAIMAMRNPGKVIRVKDMANDEQRKYRVNEKLAFKKVGNFLFKQLPSGRVLSFCKPRLTEGRYDNLQVSYECVNSKTHQWSVKHGYGGDFTQSDTQAVARDLLAHAVPKLERYGYPVVLLIHDEFIIEVPDKPQYNLDEVKEIICELPDWAEGLPVSASGFEDYLYHEKD